MHWLKKPYLIPGIGQSFIGNTQIKSIFICVIEGSRSRSCSPYSRERGIMETKKLVGMRIKSLRRGKGYSQEKLAELAGINAKYLSSVERGEENPTLDLFIRVSQSLKVDINEMFNMEYESQTPQALRKKLQSLVAEIKDQDLSRAIRILGMLIY